MSTPYLGTCSPGKAFACTVRLTALHHCQPILDPATNQPLNVVMDCISAINTTPFRETTEDIVPPRACPGKECWRIRGCTIEKYCSIDTLTLQGWNFDALQIMTNDASLFINGNVAIGHDRLALRKCDIQFALEIWSRVGFPDGECVSSAEDLAFYELYANVQNANLGGQQRDETTPNTVTIEGARNYPNPNWGLGPYGTQPGGIALPPTAIERLAFWVDAAGAPLPIPTVTPCVASGLYQPVP